MAEPIEVILRELAQAQRRTEEQIGELAKAQVRTEERVGQLEAAMERLAQAQARTEERVGRLEAAVERLAQAQARTEERVGRLEVAMEHLAQAQARTEERVGRLEAAMERLAQAQARTEERVGRLEAAMERLAQAQARTEERVEQLAQAQARTNGALRQLARQVGRLSDQLGFGLEDIAHVVLPGYLERHHGIHIESFQRKFFTIGRKLREINLYGEGRRNRHKIIVLGEVKSRIFKREVEQFARFAQRVEKQVSEEVFKLMFGYYVHPSGSDSAKRHAIELIASYQR